jgi:hypothetical protein
MKNPPKDGENPHFKSRFATLAGVRDAVLPVLSKHGLSVIQSTGSGERGPSVTTLLLHASGQWVECDPLCLPAVKQDPQAYGSALSYARRYSLMALAGVVGDDDDDGQAASKPAPAKAGKQQPQGNGKPAKKSPSLPKDGAELEQRLKSREAKLVAEGLCQSGDLLTAVTAAGVKAGYVKELVRWPAAAMQLAADETTAFVAKCKAGNGPIHAGSKEG